MLTRRVAGGPLKLFLLEWGVVANITATASNQLQGYTYTYDQENRITGAAGYTYTYDADGNRVEKSNNTTSDRHALLVHDAGHSGRERSLWQPAI